MPSSLHLTWTSRFGHIQNMRPRRRENHSLRWNPQSDQCVAREMSLLADLFEIYEIYAKLPLPISLPDYHWIFQPCGMQHSSNQTSCLKFLDLFRDELLPLYGLLSYLLLDRSGVWADSKVVL